MEILLIVAGVIAIALGFLLENPVFREKYVNPEVAKRWSLEEERVKQLKFEVIQAKEEVAQLLVELERTSEKVVDNLEETIQDIRGQLQQVKDTPTVSQLSSRQEPGYRQNLQDNGATDIDTPKTDSKSGKKSKIAKSAGQKSKAKISNPQPAEVSRHGYIYQLADEGMTAEEIAQTIKLGKGEVQLILDLRGRGE